VAKKQNHIFANNVERTTVNGRTVWRVHSAKSGRVLSVTTKSSSKRSMERTNAQYGKALQSLADR
jgi:hypothetical protein